MYVILVNEPGAETESFVLPTGASTPKAAVRLMFSRAEEYISEQLELGAEGAEDYSIKALDPLSVAVLNTNEDQPVVISFEATSIVEVV